MYRLAVVVLFLLPSVLLAQQVFRSFDENGNVVYSDQPSPGAEELEVEPIQGFSTPSVPASQQRDIATAAASEESAGYDTFAIVAPVEDDTIRNNLGNVDVALSIQPSLQADHTLRVLLDGKAIGEMAGPYVRLENIDRGTHTVAVEAFDSKGVVVASTKPVTFHLRRESLIIRRKQGRG